MMIITSGGITEKIICGTLNGKPLFERVRR